MAEPTVSDAALLSLTLKELAEWKEAIFSGIRRRQDLYTELGHAHIKYDESNPAQVVATLVRMAHALALDPSTSQEAQDLIEQGRVIAHVEVKAIHAYTKWASDKTLELPTWSQLTEAQRTTWLRMFAGTNGQKNTG